MNSEKDIEKTAVEIMQEVCRLDEINEENFGFDLLGGGLIDSLTMLDLILLIENKLGLKLQTTDFKKEDISSVNNFCRFLKEKIKNETK